MLAQRLRTLRPAPSVREIAAEEEALDAAIERIESELAWAEGGQATHDDIRDDIRDIPMAAASTDRGPIESPSRIGGVAVIAIAVIAAALGAGAYIFWPSRSHQIEPKAAKTETKIVTQQAAPAPAIKLATNGDLAPGVDGGSSDRDLPYVYRRQPTFYRTLQPVGTVIVDKLQHFLYVILPNNVAMRYGIAVGEHCADLAGLRHIAAVTESPPWQPPPDAFKRNPAVMPGGPGNPLGARLMELDDKTSRIHGTNAPLTIGNVVNFGCIRLVNDDVVDLSNRVKISTPVVVN
jgi:lipoprotein-anchoring transpeptidase ErfK/SrfK